MSSEEITFREFGESLKKARTEQSRTLDDLASYTKIHRRHLEAIESGDISQLPQGPYAKAFLREYARALGMKVPDVFASPAAPSHSSQNTDRSSHNTHSSTRKKESEEVTDREEGTLPIGAVAKETARFANAAVKSAVKTVTKTTENMVDLVETGGKEALEALTSRSLWEEAEEVRRERLGFAPRDAGSGVRSPESEKVIPPISNSAPPTPDPALQTPDPGLRPPAPGRRSSVSSKGATNVVIALLLLLFAGAAFFAIRTYKRENGNSSFASKDYIPAPLEKPQPLTPPVREKPAIQPTVPASPVISPKDSLQFTLRATQPVWVSIAPDGIPAYRGELKAGDTKSYKAGEKFVVNIGNQKSVEMRFNGQRLSNLPAIQNSSVVVRDLVLMRDHITLSGTAVDVKKLTTPPPAPVTVSKIPAHIITPPHAVATKRPFIVPLLNHGNSKNGAVPSKGTPPAQKNGQKPIKAIGNKPSNKPAKAKAKPRGNQPSGSEIHSVEPIPPRP
jgi:transcriptional regulator with XRE-family HTH domain